ncbi:glycoside hydrolase family 16 protein [Homoserinibacter sp. YIM 151385]|uniref:glycoside hydrolase family 16 protein n=1 Tax=Homoserinibacter sp. YIM 151385 TaxID=2985506 RepID=UPI0022F13398|nr:glycoside hydrolase family 16 protein [Homoserinibacter sp. YIM 151385]WBU37970.1 glycoside hydrolase family 16 protein [Homoserinibacter sp. YIM 151385]
MQGRTLRRTAAIAAAAGIALLVPFGATAAASAEEAVPASAPAPPGGFTRVFLDDFDGPAGSGIDRGNWIHQIGHSYPGGEPNWGTGEIASHTDSTENVALDGQGNLTITPRKQADGSWTSGRIETQRTDFAAPAGGVLRVEASIKQPDVTDANGMGYWPAFWMLGDAARPVGATNWPGIGEIDILESVNGRPSHFGAMHCGVAPGGPCNEFTGLTSGEQSCDGCRQSFSSYAVEYDRSTAVEEIRWYRDGVNYFTVRADQVDQQTWDSATKHGYFVILNVAMGGGFPGAFGGALPNDQTEPGHPMVVDYVQVSTRG